MSVQSKPYFWLHCDGPDCDGKSTEWSDYTAWSDVNGAEEDAMMGGWTVTEGQHFCPEHSPVAT